MDRASSSSSPESSRENSPKRPRIEFYVRRDRLSPDHAVRAAQLREQQRCQEQQSSGNQDIQAGPRKPCREVRLFGVDIAGNQRMDEKSKETAFNFFKEAELNSYQEGYQKPLDERSVKEAIAVAMYEVIIKCFKNNEQDLIQPFLREIRQLDLYKQAYGFQQQEGPHFEEDREKLPKQKPTSQSWSHEGEKRQSHQAWEEASPSKQQRTDVKQKRYQDALERFVRELKVNRKYFSDSKIRDMLQEENINIKEKECLNLLHNSAEDLYRGAKDISMKNTYNSIKKWINKKLLVLSIQDLLGS
jgi:hypothetical protein